ncbi:MAG: hded protein [Thermodesulfobacteria bacterium]|nr:hded protein [Thermodesulfobacteriota bacterium]
MADTMSKVKFEWGDVKKNWKWHLLLGFFFVITGTIGLVLTPIATLSSVLLFAAFMMAGGVLQLAEAVGATKGWKSRLLNIIAGLVYIAGGVVCAMNPVAASLALTVILAVAIFIIGVFRVVVAFQHRQELRDWGIVLISGLASIAIAVLIAISWPYSALWTLGIFISVDLIFNGWSHIVIALAARKSLEESEKEKETPSGQEVAGSASA